MKIKLDFVTNSSTTSFVMYGVEISTEAILSDLIISLTLSYMLENDQSFPSNYTSKDLRKDVEEEGEYEYIEMALTALGLELIGDYENGCFYIGISPCDIGDDETGARFKQRVKDKLVSIGIKAKPMHMVEEINS